MCDNGGINMSLSKDVSICNLISNGNIEIIGDIPDGLICSICNRLLANPYVATCGCQFCGKCIKDSLNNERRQCNGHTPLCNVDLLVIDETVVRDFRTRISVGKVTVKCLWKPCPVVLELEKMVEHLRVCSISSIHCPFQIIGCSDESISERSVDSHLESNVQMHSQLLLDANSQLKNDYDDLKKKLENYEVVINQLKEDRDKHARMLEAFLEDNQRIEGKLREESEAIIGSMRIYMEDLKKELDSSKSEMKKELDLLKTRINKECVNIFSEVAREKARNMTFNSSNEVEEHMKQDFVWIVRNASLTKGWQESNEFYKIYYKLSLRIYTDDEKISLHFRILNGAHDSFLEWPLPYHVTIGIINQNTWSIYNSSTSVEDYEKKFFGRPDVPKDVTSAGGLFGAVNSNPQYCFGQAVPFQGSSNDPCPQYVGIFGNQGKPTHNIQPFGLNRPGPLQQGNKFGIPQGGIFGNSGNISNASGFVKITNGKFFSSPITGDNTWCLSIPLIMIREKQGLLVNDSIMFCCKLEEKKN